MSLDKLFGSKDLELSKDAYIEAEGTGWEDNRNRLRVSVCGPNNYTNFIFLSKNEAGQFLETFPISEDDLSSLAGHSVYAVYRERILVGVLKR